MLLRQAAQSPRQHLNAAAKAAAVPHRPGLNRVLRLRPLSLGSGLGWWRVV